MSCKVGQIIDKSSQVLFKLLRHMLKYCEIKRSGRKPRPVLWMNRMLLCYAMTEAYFADEMVQTLDLLMKKKHVKAGFQVEESFQDHRKCRGMYFSPLYIGEMINWAVKHVLTPKSF